MLARSDILLVKFSEPPKRLLEILLKKGHSIVPVSSCETIAARLPNMANPVILSFCSGSEEESSKRVNELIAVRQANRYGIVAVGRGITKSEHILGQHYKAAATIEFPCDPVKLYEILIDLAGYCQQLPEPVTVVETKVPVQPPVLKAASSVSEQIFKIPEPDKKQRNITLEISLREYYKKFKVSDPIFEMIGDLSITGQSLGGDDLVKGISLENFLSSPQMPTNKLSSQAVHDLLWQAGEVGKDQICRVATVSSKLALALRVGEEYDESAKSAAILYVCAFGGNRELMRCDYSYRKDQAIRDKLSKLVQDSSVRVSEIDPKAGKIINMISEILGGAASPDNQVAIIASAILASDLMERACHHNGRWNPLGAHALMRKVKQGEVVPLHPKVKSTILVVLTEAVNTEASILLLPKLPQSYREMIKQIRSCNKLPLSSDEVALPIVELLPGMKISQHVISYDGAIILTAGMVLDSDIILRLWQLSAIKPLLVPLVILTESEIFELDKTDSKPHQQPMQATQLAGAQRVAYETQAAA